MFMPWLVAAGLVGLLAVSTEAGHRVGRTVRGRSEAAVGGQIGAIQGAILGLLGLLLGFCFSGATTRFIERQDLITAQANAIATAALRAELLAEPHRAELLEALQQYTALRVKTSQTISRGLSIEDSAAFERLHTRMWEAAREGVGAAPTLAMAVLPSVNAVIDFHTTRLATTYKRVPSIVIALLIVSSSIAMAAMGYGSGFSGHRNGVLLSALAVLISIALWVVIDLDNPRRGLIQVSDQPLQDLKFK